LVDADQGGGHDEGQGRAPRSARPLGHRVHGFVLRGGVLHVVPRRLVGARAQRGDRRRDGEDQAAREEHGGRLGADVVFEEVAPDAAANGTHAGADQVGPPRAHTQSRLREHHGLRPEQDPGGDPLAVGRRRVGARRSSGEGRREGEGRAGQRAERAGASRVEGGGAWGAAFRFGRPIGRFDPLAPIRRGGWWVRAAPAGAGSVRAVRGWRGGAAVARRSASGELFDVSIQLLQSRGAHTPPRGASIPRALSRRNRGVPEPLSGPTVDSAAALLAVGPGGKGRGTPPGAPRSPPDEDGSWVRPGDRWRHSSWLLAPGRSSSSRSSSCSSSEPVGWATSARASVRASVTSRRASPTIRTSRTTPTKTKSPSSSRVSPCRTSKPFGKSRTRPEWACRPLRIYWTSPG